jgi:hypothetical protein
LSFPAGLAVYWCTSGLWRIGQQYIIGKHIYTEENKARLEEAKARNEAIAAPSSASDGGAPEPGGFLGKLLGGAQPNLQPKAGRDGGTKAEGSKAATPARGGAAATARPSGRVTTPGSRPAASRKRKKRK